jgi:hypothetical protein
MVCKRQIVLFAAIIISITASGVLPSPQVTSAKAGIIQYVLGKAFLNERPLRLAKDDFVQMENGQSVRTDQGLVELLLASDVYLRLGNNTLLRMDKNRLTDTQLTLNRGSALIEVVEAIKGNRIKIAIPTGAVEIKREGLYRLDVTSRQLQVLGGMALAMSKRKKSLIKSGNAVCLEDKLAPAPFDPDAADALHQWSGKRSFAIFEFNPNSHSQTHWKPTSPGWMRNSSFRMTLYSTVFLEEWNENQRRLGEAAEKAAEALRRAKQEVERRRNDGN